MGYIECKQCGCQMSDKSEACPMCGLAVGDIIKTFTDLRYPDIEPKVGDEQNSEIKESFTKKHKPILIVFIPLLLILGITLCVYKCGGRNDVEEYTEYVEPVEYEVSETDYTAVETNAPNEIVYPIIEMTPVSREDNFEINGLSSGSIGFVFVEKAQLRRTADTESTLLKDVTYGHRVDIVDIERKWAKIKYNYNERAYILAENIINYNKFTRFHTLFEYSKRQTLNELKYRKALLYLAEKYDFSGVFINTDDTPNVLQYRRIAFSKRFEDGTSVVVFDMAVPDSDDCRQWLIEFDKADNIMYEKQIRSYDIEDIIKTDDVIYRYTIIGDKVDLP